MTANQVTRADIDTLLAFLPGFEEPGRPFQLGWKGLSAVYPDDVNMFYRLAGLPPWTDHAYSPKEAGEMLFDDARVARASLSEVGAMPTACVRGERFSDGHWAHMLESGRVQALLYRLVELRDTINP